MANTKKRIRLCEGFHAEPGDTSGHQHDVYTTIGELGGNERLHVGTLTKAAVKAWAKVETERASLAKQGGR